MTATVTPELLCVGRIGVDLYPQQQGPLAQVRTFAKSVGGSAANVAVAAARLGHDAGLVTRVGDDPFGAYLRAALQEFGVRTTWVGTDPSLATPLVFAELDPPEDPGLVFYRHPKAPDMNIGEGDIPADLLASVPIFWVTGTGLSDEPSRSATVAALEARARRGDWTVLDLDYRELFWPSLEAAGAQLARVLPHVDVAVGNRIEARAAVGTDDPDEAADRLLEAGVRLAIVKLGADGVLVATAGGQRERVAPIRVPVVCGLGAGDAFGGALCHGLLSGWDAVRTVRFANAAGAWVAGQLACADAMPTLDQVNQLLEAPAHAD